jgi:hypothetical protein
MGLGIAVGDSLANNRTLRHVYCIVRVQLLHFPRGRRWSSTPFY